MGYFVSRRYRAIGGLFTIALGAGAVLGACPGSAGATDGPERHDWAAPSRNAGVGACLDLVGNAKEFTIELRSGMLIETVYSDAQTGVEIEITNVEKHAHGQITFDFSANVAVEAVLATAHPNGIPSLGGVPAAAADLVMAQPNGLPSRSPAPWISVQVWASFSHPISHISFCWTDDDQGTTPSSEPSPTTSSSSTTTTGPSTTQSPTTTIGQSPMPTTGPVPSTEASTSVPTTALRDGSLPRTGSNSRLLLTMGAALLIGGSTLLASTRIVRRRQV